MRKLRLISSVCRFILILDYPGKGWRDRREGARVCSHRVNNPERDYLITCPYIGTVTLCTRYIGKDDTVRFPNVLTRRKLSYRRLNWERAAVWKSVRRDFSPNVDDAENSRVVFANTTYHKKYSTKTHISY